MSMLCCQSIHISNDIDACGPWQTGRRRRSSVGSRRSLPPTVRVACRRGSARRPLGVADDPGPARARGPGDRRRAAARRRAAPARGQFSGEGVLRGAADCAATAAPASSGRAGRGRAARRAAAGQWRLHRPGRDTRHGRPRVEPRYRARGRRAGRRRGWGARRGGRRGRRRDRSGPAAAAAARARGRARPRAAEDPGQSARLSADRDEGPRSGRRHPRVRDQHAGTRRGCQGAARRSRCSTRRRSKR